MHSQQPLRSTPHAIAGKDLVPGCLEALRRIAEVSQYRIASTFASTLVEERLGERRCTRGYYSLKGE